MPLAITAIDADELVGGVIVGNYSPSCASEDIDNGAGRLQSAVKRLADASCDTSSAMALEASGIIPRALKTKSSENCDSMQAWVNNEHRKSDLSKMGKRSGANCHYVEIEDDGVGNDDGVCTKNEWYVKKLDTYGCVEDNDDDIGNNDGVCNLIDDSKQQGNRKKGVWERCLESCDMAQDEPEYDCENMDLIATSIESVAEETENANAKLKSMISSYNRKGAQLQALSSEDSLSDPCLLVSNVSIEFEDHDNDGNIEATTYGQDPYSFREDTPLNLQGWEFAAAVGESIHDICSDSFDTTIFGNDYPAVCVSVVVINRTLRLMSSSREILDDAITGARIDNMTLCMEQMAAELGGMDEKLDLILDYLIMPQGQRPDFPQKP
jgi:hypothetical protein